MRKLTFLALIFGLIFSLQGCATKCDNFDTAILDWMPSRVGDKITIQDTLSSYELSVTTSRVDHTVKVGRHTDCLCEDRYSVTLNTSWLNIDMFFHNSKMVENSDVVVNDELLNFSERVPDQTINGIKYTDLVVYKNQNQAASAQYKELVIARSVGFISLTSAAAAWARVDTDLRESDPARVAFNDFSCL